MSNFFRSHSNVIIALGTGIAVGATVTLIVHRIGNTFGRDLARLVAQIESLKKDVEQLRSTLEENNANKARGFYSVHASSGEEDDDFQEAIEGGEDSLGDQSYTSDDYVSVRSSDSIEPTEVRRLFQEVDSLLEGSDDDTIEAYQLLKEKERVLCSHSGFLWRMAKAAFNMSQVEGAKGNVEEKKKFIYISKDKALQSLQINQDDANAHKWAAIALGSVGDYEGTQAKILNGYKFKEHIERAIEMKPEDPSALHLMGRWCFGVYMLSWIERKAASALFATPPTSTVDEALNNFLKAEQLNPGKWKENILFISKCYIEKRDYYVAVEWLDKANGIKPINQDDRDSQKEIDNLLYKYSGYRR